jgi:anti-sigma factor RsiW
MEHHIDDHVSAYMDNELPPTERLEIESHLQSCVRCSQLVYELMDLQLQVVASFQTISSTDNLEKRVWDHINFRKTIKSWIFTAILSFCILCAVFLFFGTVIIGVF